MSLSLMMARRYLFSRKRMGAIHIISIIATLGVAFGTAALLCTLCVFDGFSDLIGSLYTRFDPEVKVVPVQGKLCAADDPVLTQVRSLPEVEASADTYEDNALILFRGRPTVITIKGVDAAAYDRVCDIRSILYGTGRWRLEEGGVQYGVPGIGLAASMGSINYGTLQICAPRRGERINLLNPIESFSTADLASPDVCFQVSQSKYDLSYMLTSLHFAQDLFEQPGLITALELRLKPGSRIEAVKGQIDRLGQGRYRALDRMEQQEDYFAMNNIERLTAYIFLTFILFIVCFNVIGSVFMLLLDKRDDLGTLSALGMTQRQITHLFLLQGWMICAIGAVCGTLLGLLLCWLQDTFGLIKLGGSTGSFIIEAYPVSVHAYTVPLVLSTVLFVGFVCTWWPVSRLVRRYL